MALPNSFLKTISYKKSLTTDVLGIPTAFLLYINTLTKDFNGLLIANFLRLSLTFAEK